MRKTLCATLGLLLMVGLAYAEPDYVDIPQIVNVSTGGVTAVTTNTGAVNQYGYVRAVQLDLSGYASPTVDVDVVTKSSGVPAITILSTNSVTADFILFPYAVPVTSAGLTVAGAVVEIPVPGEQIQVWLSNANSTGVNAKVEVILDVDR